MAQLRAETLLIDCFVVANHCIDRYRRTYASGVCHNWQLPITNVHYWGCPFLSGSPATTTNLNAIGNERTSDEIANSDAHRVSAHVSGAWGPSIALSCIPRPRAGEGSTDVPETRRRMTNPMAIDHNIDKRTDSDAYFVILIP